MVSWYDFDEVHQQYLRDGPDMPLAFPFQKGAQFPRGRRKRGGESNLIEIAKLNPKKKSDLEV